MTGGRHLKPRWPIYVLVAGILLISAYIGANAYIKTLGPRVRSRVVKALAARFDSDVDLAYFDIALLPQPTVVGEGLTIRHKGWGDAPPLIHIRRFSAQTDLVSALGAKNEVRLVTLEGLEIHIPSRGRQAILNSLGEKSRRGESNKSRRSDETEIRYPAHYCRWIATHR